MSSKDKRACPEPPRPGTPIKKRQMRGELTKAEKVSFSGKTKQFQPCWLQDAVFKKWLRRVPSDATKAQCAVCRSIMVAGKSELTKHTATLKHIQGMKALQGTRSMSEALEPMSTETKNIKSAEIMLSAFFVEHNIAISTSDHLVDLLKRAIPDSTIIMKMTLDRTKTTSIIQNVISKSIKEDLITTLKRAKFSVLVDESTDISNKKNLVLLVKYVCPATGCVCTPLLDVIELDATDCSAEKLWGQFTSRLEYHQIPWKENLVGVACDHASVMVGSKNSFFSRFKSACPWGVLMDCICHSSHLAASAACRKLPDLATRTIRRLATYVSSSPKRCAILEEFQLFHLEESKRILRVSTTRWLVLHSCVKRILENLVPIQQFLLLVSAEDPKDADAKELLRDLRNPFLKAYLLFLRHSLSFFNEMNALFQSEKTLVHKLQEASKSLMKKLCSNFLMDEHLEFVHCVDISSPHFQVPLENVYFGPEVKEILANMPFPDNPNGLMNEQQMEAQRALDIKNFQSRCLDFYVTAALQLKKYLPLNNLILKEASFIDPAIAVSVKDRKELPDLPHLANNFKDCLKLDVDELNREWRSIPHEIPSQQRGTYSAMTPEAFWFEVGKMQNYNQEKLFPSLVKLAQVVLAFPHSNAEAERVFSALTDIKTKKRNCMGELTLDSLLVARTHMRQTKTTCATFKVTEKQLLKHNQNMYVHHAPAQLQGSSCARSLQKEN